MACPKIYNTVDILCCIGTCVNVLLGVLLLIWALTNPNQPRYLDVVCLSFKFEVAWAPLLVPLMMLSDYNFTCTILDNEKHEP